MKASERALHVSRLSDRISQSAGKGCRKGLQERAVIGSVLGTKNVPEFIELYLYSCARPRPHRQDGQDLSDARRRQHQC